MYWVNTKKYCGAVSVDDNDFITFKMTAPCFIWAAKKRMKFSSFKNFLSNRGQLLDYREVSNG
jgi:hypothetical protein